MGAADVATVATAAPAVLPFGMDAVSVWGAAGLDGSATADDGTAAADTPAPCACEAVAGAIVALMLPVLAVVVAAGACWVNGLLSVGGGMV